MTYRTGLIVAGINLNDEFNTCGKVLEPLGEILEAHDILNYGYSAGDDNMDTASCGLVLEDLYDCAGSVQKISKLFAKHSHGLSPEKRAEALVALKDCASKKEDVVKDIREAFEEDLLWPEQDKVFKQCDYIFERIQTAIDNQEIKVYVAESDT